MHDREQQSSGGAIAVIAIILVLLLIVGILAAGGIGFVVLRNRQSVQYEQEMLQEAEMARAEAETVRAMAEENEARAQAALVEAQVASATDEDSESPTSFTIQLDAAGNALVDGETLEIETLTKRLQAAIDDQGGSMQVTIEAHGECPQAAVSGVIDNCLKAGVRDVRIGITEDSSLTESD